MADYIDPTEVDPAHYKLLGENERTRIIEITLPAGETDILHSHTVENVYFITGGKARIDVPGADSMEAEIPDGHVMFSDAWTHQVHNIGDTDIHAIIVEHKD